MLVSVDEFDAVLYEIKLGIEFGNRLEEAFCFLLESKVLCYHGNGIFATMLPSKNFDLEETSRLSL